MALTLTRQRLTPFSPGIGKVSAIALGKAGWKVVITARDEAKLKETVSEIEDGHVIAGDLVSDMRDNSNTVYQR
jgi:NADP-dependent 3-hydroxy acid dehydrogenase YdfG